MLKLRSLAMVGLAMVCVNLAGCGLGLQPAEPIAKDATEASVTAAQPNGQPAEQPTAQPPVDPTDGVCDVICQVICQAGHHQACIGIMRGQLCQNMDPNCPPPGDRAGGGAGPGSD